MAYKHSSRIRRALAFAVLILLGAGPLALRIAQDWQTFLLAVGLFSLPFLVFGVPGYIYLIIKYRQTGEARYRPSYRDPQSARARRKVVSAPAPRSNYLP